MEAPSLSASWRPLGPSGSVIIATAEPAAFEQAFGAWGTARVMVTDNAASVIEALSRRAFDRLLADYRQLADGWTGRRFAQYVRGEAALAGTEVWLMSAQPQAGQEQWARHFGVAGLLPRDPQTLAATMFGDVASAAGRACRLDDVDEAFKLFAGPLAGMHIESARSEVMELGAQYRRAAYIRALTARLSLLERRDAFRAAIDRHRPSSRPESNP